LISYDQAYIGDKYTHSVDIVPGEYYYFRVRAWNKWGQGEESDTSVGIIAATIPDRVDVPATSIDVITGDLVVTWLQPYNNGAQIDSY
jgi:hypothetical protein